MNNAQLLPTTKHFPDCLLQPEFEASQRLVGRNWRHAGGIELRYDSPLFALTDLKGQFGHRRGINRSPPVGQLRTNRAKNAVFVDGPQLRYSIVRLHANTEADHRKRCDQEREADENPTPLRVSGSPPASGANLIHPSQTLDRRLLTGFDPEAI